MESNESIHQSLHNQNQQNESNQNQQNHTQTQSQSSSLSSISTEKVPVIAKTIKLPDSQEKVIISFLVFVFFFFLTL